MNFLFSKFPQPISHFQFIAYHFISLTLIVLLFTSILSLHFFQTLDLLDGYISILVLDGFEPFELALVLMM